MHLLKEKLSHLSASSLYFFRNIFGFIILILYAIVGIYINIVKINPIVYNSLCVILLLILAISYWFAINLDKIIVTLLVEKIAIRKYEAYWQKNIGSAFGSKASAFHALGVTHFYRGYFEESLSYFEKSKHSRFQTKKARQRLESHKKQFILQDKLFLAIATNETNDVVDNIDTLIGDSPYLKAVSDIIYYQKENSFFESYQPTTKLARLMSDFYKAKNYQLRNEMDKAKNIFEMLSNENPELFIVQEARKNLKNSH
ncbi:hypothetical protein [Streptococcus zalophi]|uniref:hypothetical protein n=1 Tax=Streptococcus zalophi TaxID=640031 RepID=UPI00215C15CC|nr:hypothetical protein [Streptococcus zalophi]MCR8967269.1 hypothetical protein [Streptococcus zalophi]